MKQPMHTGERHCPLAVAFMVAGGGFEPPTFGLCDLTHLSMRVGLYLHPSGCSPSSLYAFPHNSEGLVRYCPITRATQVPPTLTSDLPVHCCTGRPVCNARSGIPRNSWES